MKNYEYIIAGLPIINQNFSSSLDSLISDIKELLDISDKETVDFFLSAFAPDAVLDGDFYKKALSHKNSFIRTYFDFDLNLRNLKVKYLNKRLGRKEDMDLVVIDSREECEYAPNVLSVLENTDILKRERGLDDLYWKEIDEVTLWDYFNLNFILGFIAKVKIIDRWNKLDAETGRELFRRLVDEIRSTYDNKKTNLI